MGVEFFFLERFHYIITGLFFACWLDIVYLDNLQSSYITYILWLLDYFAFPRLSWIGQVQSYLDFGCCLLLGMRNVTKMETIKCFNGLMLLNSSQM